VRAGRFSQVKGGRSLEQWMLAGSNGSSGCDVGK
jgi:hypothetical protein